MDKKIAGLLGAVAALGAVSSSQAAPAAVPSDALRATTYAELLEPIGNASALLKAIDDQRAANPDDGLVQLARYHHHHHHHYRRPHRHHHHHHHH